MGALAARRHLVEQLGDLGQEAEVRHLVGLVEDGDLHVLQGAGAAVDDVAQAARVATRTSTPRSRA
ncbi:hypothetical protein SMICM304S_06634 [Streptomyces microflavus]